MQGDNQPRQWVETSCKFGFSKPMKLHTFLHILPTLHVPTLRQSTPLLFVGILSLFRGRIDLASDPLLSQIDLPHLFIHYPPPRLPQAHRVILCHWGKVSSDSCTAETSSAEVSFLMQAVLNKLAACFCCPQVDVNVSALQVKACI